MTPNPRLPELSDVAELWSEALDIAIPDPSSNFFSIGGDSLMAAGMVVQARRRWGGAVSLATLLEAPVLREFHQRLVQASLALTKSEGIPQRPEGSPLRVSYNQAIRLTMDDQAVRSRGSRFTDNIVIALSAQGTLSHDRLTGALDYVARRHSVLRSVFRDGQVSLAGTSTVELITVDATSWSPEQVAERLRSHANTVFDLSARPPWSVLLIHGRSSGDVLSLCFDHLLIDRESVSVLLEQLATGYQVSTKPGALAPSYYDWADWQRSVVGPVVLREVRDRTPPGDVLVPTLALRIERDRGESRLGMVRRNLPKSVAAAAAHRAASEGGSLFQWMVLALALALDPIREPGPFGVVVPIANRDHPDAAPLVGWLSSLGCIRLRLNWSQGLSGMATQVRQALAVASATAALPVRIVEEHLAGDIPVSPRPRVYFDYVAADPTAVVLDRVRLDEIEAPATPYLMPGLSFWATKNVDGSIGLLLCFDLGRLSESDAEAILECFELALAASCGKGDGDLDGLRGAMSAVIHKAGPGLVVDSGGGSRNS